MPVIFPIALGVIALAFIAVPVLLIGNMVRTRNRQKTWLPTTAKVVRVHMDTRGTDDSRRTVMVGTYEYYDRNEQVHTGSGDLGTQGIAVDGSPQVIDIVVDPLDPTRSQIVQQAGAGNLTCAVVVCFFFAVIGLIALLGTVALFLGGE